MRILLLAFLSLLLSEARAQKSTIQTAEVARLVKTLSADDMQGRNTLEPGNEKAARFIAQEFKKIGLQYLPGLKSYFQTFQAYQTKPGKPELTLNGKAIAEENVLVHTSQARISWAHADSLPVSMVTIPEGANFRQLAGPLLEGQENTLVLVHPSHSDLFKKFRNHFSQGSVSLASGEQKGTHVFVLTDAGESRQYGFTMNNQVDTLTMRNVVGVLPGKSRKGEQVVFSGHYDHLGILKPVNGDSIANGADDDASGTTAVISLARHFKTLKNNQRTLVFVAFTAEEIGGYGSQYFSAQLDPKSITAMFNIEMIGKRSKFGPNTAWITGFEETDFGKILQKNLTGSPYTFYPDPYPAQHLFYRSDNATLARKGVPAHSISTDEIDIDKLYHSVDDEFETLDIPSMTNVIRAIAVSARSIVAGKDTPSRVNPAGLK
jgi:hypothetical protein